MSGSISFFILELVIVWTSPSLTVYPAESGSGGAALLEETPKHLARRDSGAPPRMESIQIYSLERFTERCVCLFCLHTAMTKSFERKEHTCDLQDWWKCLGHYIHRELFELPFPVPETQSAFHPPFLRAIRRIAFATHCQSFHLHFVISGSSASRTFFSPNLVTSCLSWCSISPVIGAWSSGGNLSRLRWILTGFRRLCRFERSRARCRLDRLRPSFALAMQFNNAFQHHPRRTNDPGAPLWN